MVVDALICGANDQPPLEFLQILFVALRSCGEVGPDGITVPTRAGESVVGIVCQCSSELLFLYDNGVPATSSFTPCPLKPIIRIMSDQEPEYPWLDSYAAKLPEDQRDHFLQFFPPWLKSYLGGLGEAERNEFLVRYDDSFHESVEILTPLPLNSFRDGSESGSYSVRIGNSDLFVNLNTAFWTTAKYVGPVILAAAVSPLLLIHLGITAPHLTAVGGASAAALLYKAFAKLQPMELDSYQAVAAAIERNKNRVLANSGASLDEVRESFRLNGDLLPPKSLEAMLDQLVDKKVLERKVLGGVEQFFLAF